jgi:DNA-binding response OmpR family regulator
VVAIEKDSSQLQIFPDYTDTIWNTMQSILLIEDQIEYQILVKHLLASHCRVTVAESGARATVIARTNIFDLVLLDVVLPDVDGFHLFNQLRAIENLNSVGIVFLTAKELVTDRVTGFALGAEDYIVKPFEPLEFCARIEAKLHAHLLRKSQGELVTKGRLQFDRDKMRALVIADGNEQDLHLTLQEFRLLIHFASHEGHVLSRDQLLTAVWGHNTHVGDRTVDRHISSLRRKLEGQPEFIESVHGLGYRFKAAS